jgi:hypothetical protein
VLAAYLYTKRADVLLAALFPCAPPTDVVADICRGADLLLPASSPSDTTSPATDAPTTPTSALAAFTVHLRATYTPRALMGALGRVHGVWANACALGVVCDGTYPGAGDGTGVWGVMEGAWRVLVGGLGGVWGVGWGLVFVTYVYSFRISHLVLALMLLDVQLVLIFLDIMYRDRHFLLDVYVCGPIPSEKHSEPGGLPGSWVSTPWRGFCWTTTWTKLYEIVNIFHLCMYVLNPHRSILTDPNMCRTLP